MKAFKRIYFVGAYYLSWFLFFAVGLGLNLFSLPLLLLPHRESRGQWMRAIIRSLFDLWVRWFHACRIIDIRWRGFDQPLPAGCVYIANHPTLLDATFLLARLPEAICIFKPALMRNPVIGPPAIMAGYVAGEQGVDLVREIAEKISGGCSLLVFPEGTRTGPGLAVGPCKPGFALLATRAQAPVQLVLIRATPDLVPRGRPWWKPPQIQPAVVELSLDRRWEFDPDKKPVDLTAEVQAYLEQVLAPAKA